MKKELYILWTNSDPITSEKMMCMYAINSMLRSWWDKVTVIIWGSTAKLVAESEFFQLKMEELKNAGVSLSACIGCANQLGVTEKLRSLGIEVKGWGESLSRLLQTDAKIITV